MDHSYCARSRRVGRSKARVECEKRMATEWIDFAVCIVAYTSKPRFRCQLPWWPHLMTIPWEWSVAVGASTGKPLALRMQFSMVISTTTDIARQRHRPFLSLAFSPQLGTADAEIKDSSDENPQLKVSPYKAWNRWEYSLSCFTYCQGFLPWTNFYLVVTHDWCRFPCWMPTEYK